MGNSISNTTNSFRFLDRSEAGYLLANWLSKKTQRAAGE